MNMKMGIEAALRICFLLFLLSASWQDLKKKTIKNILAHTVLTILAIVWVSPLFWILLTKYVPDMGNGRGHSSGSTYFQPDFYGNRKNGDAGDRTGSYGPYVCSFIGNFVIKPFYCYGRSYGKRRWLFLIFIRSKFPVPAVCRSAPTVRRCCCYPAVCFYVSRQLFI